MRTFQEGNQRDKALVARFTRPRRHDDCVVGLQRVVLWVYVESDNLCGVTIEVRDVL